MQNRLRLSKKNAEGYSGVARGLREEGRGELLIRCLD